MTEKKNEKSPPSFPNTNTSIENVKIGQGNKEREVDPTIKQYWGCGELEPNHNTQDCSKTPICMKCGQPGHNFLTVQYQEI